LTTAYALSINANVNIKTALPVISINIDND